MNSGSFDDVMNKMFFQIRYAYIYIYICMYKQDFALNNQPVLVDIL